MRVLVERAIILRAYVEVDYANQGPIIARKMGNQLDWKHVKDEYDVNTAGLTHSQIYGNQDIVVNCIYNGDLEKSVTEDEVVNVLNQRIKDYGTPDSKEHLPDRNLFIFAGNV